jgi:AmmeMemoRadiSam system protein B
MAVPLLVGDATPSEVAAALNQLWGGPETVIVVSSDLSHFHNDETARRRDAATADMIERGAWTSARRRKRLRLPCDRRAAHRGHTARAQRNASILVQLGRHGGIA